MIIIGEIAGWIFGIALFCKIILHAYLNMQNGKVVVMYVPRNFPPEIIFLKFYDDVDPKYKKVKQICNICYYAYVIALPISLLFLIAYSK